MLPVIVLLVVSGCRHSNEAYQEPTITVGLLEGRSVTITQRDTATNKAVEVINLDADRLMADTLIEPHAGCVLEVHDVTIGKKFHWQQTQTQQFEGRLNALKRDSTIVLINEIPLEKYLTSVISSEMNASAPLEFLKAHAIISRSWLLAQISKPHYGISRQEDGQGITVWYDRDDHSLYDVCADDHCQRYQGISQRNRPVEDAVEATRGLVLMYGDTLCDTRFSKCCGGITELFQNCWEPTPKGYLTALADRGVAVSLPDFDNDSVLTEYILHGNDSDYCAHPSQEVLATVLNDYDLDTRDFYRWTDTIPADLLGERVKARTGRDLGYITRLQAIERGPSGRIVRLKITGSKDTLTVGKELEIRRVLSDSHLYSSAFIASRTGEGPEAIFVLNGAGWGHGVGLCQIGAATMAYNGYTCDSILHHYFPKTEITQYGKRK